MDQKQEIDYIQKWVHIFTYQSHTKSISKKVKDKSVAREQYLLAQCLFCLPLIVRGGCAIAVNAGKK